MMLHFAYGSNMHGASMRRRCPAAEALGVAVLDGYRFFISADGYASVAPDPSSSVRGVLWRLTARDLAAVNAYENIQSGLYRSEMLSVTAQGRRQQALVYIGRSRVPGTPKPGYLDLVVSAAGEWKFPADYVAMLSRFARGGLTMRAAPSGAIA